MFDTNADQLHNILYHYIKQQPPVHYPPSDAYNKKNTSLNVMDTVTH